MLGDCFVTWEEWSVPMALALASAPRLPMCAGPRYLGGARVLLVELVVLAALVLVLLMVDFELGAHCLHAVFLDNLVLRTPSASSEATWAFRPGATLAGSCPGPRPAGTWTRGTGAVCLVWHCTGPGTRGGSG